MSKFIKICDSCDYMCSKYEVDTYQPSGCIFKESAFPIAIPRTQYRKYLAMLYKKAKRTGECRDWRKKTL